MNFTDSKSYKYFQCICLWSLLSDLVIILSFLASYALVPFIDGWGAVGWIVPLAFIGIFLLCYVIANAFLGLIIYQEFKEKRQIIPSVFVEKTEFIFNTAIKNNIVGRIINFLSVVSYMIKLALSVLNFLMLFIGMVFFAIFLVISKTKNN